MQHLSAFIADLALILGSAAVFSLIFKWLKQPVVLGYLLAGLVVGPNFDLFPTVVETEGIQTWAEIGVIFLLFGLGLEFSFKKLIRIGGVAGLTAVFEVFLTLVTGYLLGRLLGWQDTDCWFFGGILSIASTTIIIRSFDELGVKTHKFAGLVTGILVIEDLVAVILMVVLSTLSVSREFEGLEMMESILKLLFFLVLWFVSGIYFLPTLLRITRKFLSEETLLVMSVALCLLMVVLAYEAGFSPALGAFIMGSLLAETNTGEKIEHLIKPLKNIFGAVFFVSVGMLIDVSIVIEHYIPVLLGTAVLLFAKPLFVITGSLITGQTLRTAIQSGMSLSQIGEFSFIIAALGLSLNVISDHLYPVAVAISVLTTFTTPFMIRLSTPFHAFVERSLPRRWSASLLRYSTGAQRVSEVSALRLYVRDSLVNVLILSVVIISVILLSNRYLLAMAGDNDWNRAIATAIAFLLLTPFLWALAFRGVKRITLNPQLNRLQRGPLLALIAVRIGLVLFFIGMLFDTFYSTAVAIAGLLSAVIFLILFRKKIRSYYIRIENRFISNLHGRDTDKQLNLLTPWDSHIATFELPSVLPIIGLPLAAARLREDFGINIAVIRRGDRVINVPSREEKLYPNDIVSVIGTDGQLNAFRDYIETETRKAAAPVSGHEVSLQHFTLGEYAPLAGQSIRDSGIREQTRGLVVGVERNGKRILNPESDFVLLAHDTIWLVGDEKRIRVLIDANITRE